MRAVTKGDRSLRKHPGGDRCEFQLTRHDKRLAEVICEKLKFSEADEFAVSWLRTSFNLLKSQQRGLKLWLFKMMQPSN